MCDPCSRNRVPLPTIGLTVSVRVCDRCYHDLDGFWSYLANDDSIHYDSREKILGEEANRSHEWIPERQRSRRSPIVDDLTARIHQNLPVAFST